MALAAAAAVAGVVLEVVLPNYGARRVAVVPGDPVSEALAAGEWETLPGFPLADREGTEIAPPGDPAPPGRALAEGAIWVP